MNETDFQALLHEHADALSPSPPDPDRLIARGRARKLHRRQGLIGAVVVLLAGAVTSVELTTGGSPSPSTITVRPPKPSPSALITPTPTHTPAPIRTPTTSQTPVVATPTKLPVRWSAGTSGPPLTHYPDTATVVGSRTIYWGGEIGQDAVNGYTNKGAVLDTATRRWSNTAPSPLAGRISAGASGSSRLLFLWGGSGTKTFADGATYDPIADAWHKVSPSPLSARIPLGVTWTGTEFVVVGGAAGQRILSDCAAYNPATNTWRKLPDLPASFPKGKVAHVAGRTVLIAGGALPATAGNTVAYGLSDASAAWERLPDPPPFTDDQLAVATDGTDLFASGTSNPLIIAAYSFTTGAWRASTSPLPLMNCHIELAVTETEVIAGMCNAIAVQNRATGAWLKYPDNSFGDLIPGSPLVVGLDTVVFNTGTLFYR